MAKKYIDQFLERDPVDDIFVLAVARLGETKTGQPFLAATLSDRTGSMEGRLWDDAEKFAATCREGAIVRVTGTVQNFRGALQMKMTGLSPAADSDYDPAWFMPVSGGDTEAMAAEFFRLLESVSDRDVRRLLKKIFRPGPFFDRFKKAPAAKAMHHAYLGGLLEHTLAVALLADKVAGLYPELDRSLLLAGAFLHDVGKMEELGYDAPPIGYTDRGRLVGHLVMGSELVARTTAELDGFPEELMVRVQHLILSHHGRLEFGSPTLPMMAEAMALNFIDELDSKLAYFRRLSKQAGGEGYQWTEYQRAMERYLFVRPADMALSAQQSPDEDGPASGRQQTLFD